MTIKEKLIYLAGIVDGEGHFYVAHKTNGKGYKSDEPQLIVVNTDQPLVDWLKANFGGYYHTYPTGSDTRRACKPLHRWVFGGKKAVELAKRLRPYLIVKREQVKRVL